MKNADDPGERTITMRARWGMEVLLERLTSYLWISDERAITEDNPVYLLSHTDVSRRGSSTLSFQVVNASSIPPNLVISTVPNSGE